MLFTLGLFLLLTPFPSFQTPTNEKRDSTGSEATKANAVFTLLKPKTTVALAKQTVRPTLKPNTVNQTVLPTPTANQKPPMVNASATTKSKPSPAVIQTTPSAPIKAAAAASGTTTNKDKHTVSVNQTVSTKSSSASEVKATKDKPGPTVGPNTKSTAAKSVPAKNIKDKLQTSVTQTVLVKSPSTSDGTTAKDKPAPTGTPNVQATAPKSASVSGTKNSKDKPQPSVNQTVSSKSPSTSDGKTAKDKPTPTGAPNVQSVATKSASASGAKTTKNKPTSSVSQTADTKNTRDKPASTVIPTVMSTPTKAPTVSSSTADKIKAAASANQTTVIKAPTITKEKPQPAQPLKVVISDGCDSSRTKEQELELKPGSPLVMTHKISLVPGGCTGGCEAEMAALKGRVAWLEKEMSLLKDKCPCSANCPYECSGNGECEKGKCICHQGFTGPDCKVAKEKAKVTVETVTLQVNKDSNVAVKEGTQTGKVEKTLFHKKDKKGSEAKETDTKAKVGLVKTQIKQDASVKKSTTKGSSVSTKTSTIGNFLLKQGGRKQEEVRTGKTTVLTPKKVVQKTDIKLVREETTGKVTPKSGQLKDEPHTNVTQTNVKKLNGTAKIVTVSAKVVGANKTRPGKEVTEQSTTTEKHTTQSSGQKHQKKVKVDNVNEQLVDNRNTDDGKMGKGKVIQKSQYIVNTTFVTTSDQTSTQQNKTTVSSSGTSTKRTGGSGLGSVRVVNASSYSFILTWSAPQGMFKNFTVIRREPRMEGDEDEHEELEEEEVFKGDKASMAKNTTEVQVQSETNNTTTATGKGFGSRGKAETKRVSMVVPGNTRSMEFSNLRANTRYVLYMYGTGADRRSKIHRVTAVTGPEPATEMVFSNVTESSLSVSWTKPKAIFTGFRITYINIVTGESHSLTTDSEQGIVLPKLSAGTSYIITVTTLHGRAQSDTLTSIITTVPAPPTHLRAVNVTDTKALLKWTPSLGKVDRFIVSYESSKTPNVTVTVMLSGNSVEHQLRGLQRGTLYTVKVLSQKDSLQSTAISTTFTTANAVKASEVGARYAVIAWRSSSAVYHSYRLTYQVAGEETKEIILDSTTTEYKLTGLLPMSRYIVLVQGERDGYYTSVVTTEFITGKLRFPFPTECSQELLNGALHSGEVDIYPQGKEGPVVRVYCDMETDGGGWTVFQRRMNGKTDFYRTWSEYSTGFGNISEEFWLGNELLHNLTSIGPVSLRVDLRSGNDTAYAHYTEFFIDSEEKHYGLTLSGYTGTAGDSMRYHNGRPFSTRDKDPDPLGIHCSKAYMGGWWYKNCYKTNLNGLYGINSNNQGIVWIDWKGKDSSIPFTEMKFRPSRFSPATHG